MTDSWEDDPSADERWNAGCDFAMLALCSFMGVDPQMVTWDAATETVDGDVRAVIGNILRAKMGEDWSPLAAQPEYLSGCQLRGPGECQSRGMCQSMACVHRGKVIVKRVCVEPKVDGIVYPKVGI